MHERLSARALPVGVNDAQQQPQDRLVGSTRDKRRGEERPPVERRNHADPARGLHLCTSAAALCPQPSARSPLPAALCPQRSPLHSTQHSKHEHACYSAPHAVVHTLVLASAGGVYADIRAARRAAPMLSSWGTNTWSLFARQHARQGGESLQPGHSWSDRSNSSDTDFEGQIGHRQPGHSGRPSNSGAQ